jgi:hypothetical protein
VSEAVGADTVSGMGGLLGWAGFLAWAGWLARDPFLFKKKRVLLFSILNQNLI